MKVCTDACIFGAYIPCEKLQNIIDIGTGTGLLSLMLAQRATGARITAIDIDKEASEQAKENIINSPFNDRIEVVNADIKDYGRLTADKFDLVITNPPFFQNSLKSLSKKINIAQHDSFLNFDELIESVIRIIKPDGIFYVLLPIAESTVFEEKMTLNNFNLRDRLLIKNRADLSPFRIITGYSLASFEKFTTKELAIKNNDNEYTHSFSELLKDYYLN